MTCCCRITSLIFPVKLASSAFKTTMVETHAFLVTVPAFARYDPENHRDASKLALIKKESKAHNYTECREQFSGRLHCPDAGGRRDEQNHPRD